jgi:hypothetical protein
VLRECARVLRTGGLLAVVAIECRPGLSAADTERARVLGPADVQADAALVEMVTSVGLEALRVVDWTDELRTVAKGTISALESRAGAIRRAEGDAVYEEELGKKVRMVEGIDRGLLARTLVVARRGGPPPP